MTKKIKLFDAVEGKEEEKAIIQVLKSHFWASGAGKGNVSKFEKAFNDYVGSKQCVAVNSGTAALHLALSLINIKNKEVILPSLSFVSTAHSILYNGGKPVFVDVDPETLCLNADLIEKYVTTNTKAILPVHFGGMPCKMDKISQLCKHNHITLVEDAAHAAGAKFHNKKIGTHGSLVCFSFHPIKNLAMPTGGAITLNRNNSNNFQTILKSRRWCGIADRKGPKYNIKELGWNYYMNEFSAAIGIVQLKRLDKMNSKRKKIAKRFSEEINVTSKMPFNKDCSYHLYWILISNRDDFIKKMEKNGIETAIHYLPIHSMTFFKKKLSLPVTEKVGKSIVSLPIHPNLKDDDVNKIIKLTNRFAK